MRIGLATSVAAAIAIGVAAITIGGGGGGTATFFIGQSVAGNSSGSSCANQQSAAYFNTAGNWGAGHNIAPGVVVGLCGTISTSLTAQGSGTVGNPITLQFQTGARLSQAFCPYSSNGANGCLVISGLSYIVVDGGTNGIIESTANGTGLANQQHTTGINAQPCNNCEIKNVTLQNLYIKAPPLGQAEISNSEENAIKFSGSNILIHDNTVHDASWAVWDESIAGDTNVRVYNNTISRIDHGFTQAGGNAGTIFFYNNHIYDMNNWDNTANDIHHDGIHCYTAGTGGVAKHIDDFYIYNNLFDGNAGENATSWIFMEGGSGVSSTPCADATSRLWFFNNYGTYASSPLTTGFNGVFEDESPGVEHWYNNTQIGVGTGGSSRVCAPGVVAGSAWRNNICSTGNQVGSINWVSGWESGSPNNNIYLNAGTNAWFCTDSVGTNHFYADSQFTSFQGCVGGAGEAASSYTASASLAPATGAGANLTSLCSGNLVALCSTRLGVARPAGGAWNSGSD